jgi:hypothetical protein
MLQGDKSSYSDRQKRQAELIEASLEDEGIDTKSAEARIWAAANKLTRDTKEQIPE